MKATQRVLLRIAVAVGLMPFAWPLAAADKPKTVEKAPAAVAVEKPKTPEKAVVGKPAEKPKTVEKAPAAEPVNNCLLCHGNKDVWEGETLNRYVTEKDFHNDIHWQKGLRCVDCHGGNPKTDEQNLAHLKEDGFRLIKSPGDIPAFCGRCHSDIEYMRRYQPSPRTDQLAEYWTSGHGKHLKSGDMKVATCVSCHDRPHGSGKATGKHGILPASDMNSPVYPSRVAATCATCHADKTLMAGRRYNGKLLPCDEYAKWRQSVHGRAMMDKGDLSAATCNNCHGNHGAGAAAGRTPWRMPAGPVTARMRSFSARR